MIRPPPAPLVAARVGDYAWARVQYETTQLPTQDIARMIGVTPTALTSHASRNGWTKDAAKATTTKAAELIAAARMREEDKRAQELEVIERVNVEMQATVLVRHRSDIARAQGLTMRLLTQLEAADADADELEVLERRSSILSKLSSSMKTFVLLERQAYGINTAILEPEAEQQITTPAEDAMTKLMHKFATVLAKDMGPAHVIENDKPTPADT